MAAATTTKTTPASDMPDLANKIREQLLSTLRQGQQLSLEATENWVKAVSVIPALNVSELPSIPGVPAIPGVEAATRFTFDVAADLLSAQRDFALKLASVLSVEKSA